jgi:hypothetical protein
MLAVNNDNKTNGNRYKKKSIQKLKNHYLLLYTQFHINVHLSKP